MYSGRRFTWPRARTAALVGGLLSVVLSGCQLPAQRGDQTEGLSPVLIRMRENYADLKYGPFISLADFEKPVQAGLFRITDAEGFQADRAQPTISILRSRNETGAGGLKVRLKGAADVLRFDGVRSEQLALLRDWQKYQLLLMSMYGPPGGATIEVAVSSGTENALRWQRTVHLAPGWSLFGFDLAEIGDEIDLSDVRAVLWRAPEIDAPIDLYLDDIILADNTRYRFGENAAEGELYLFFQGRRIHVGARDRFELAFDNGLITAWRGDGSENLTVRGGMGPWPVPLGEEWSVPTGRPLAYDDPRLFATWGATVAAAQQIVEASAARVVLRGTWRYLDRAENPGAAAQDDNRPAHRWQYTIYADGRILVRVTSSARQVGWPAQRAGYALALDARRGFATPHADTLGSAARRSGFVLLSRAGPERADLLWTPYRAELTARRLEFESDDERRIVVVAGQVPGAVTLDTAHLLRFWPRDIDAVPEAGALAADYQQPAEVRASVGSLATDVEGDLDHDGFNESEGCYELDHAGGHLRFSFDPRGRLRHRPIFRVRRTADLRCWIYVDGRIIEPLGRDGQGRLLFLLPRAVNDPTTVEVHSRPRPKGP